MKTFKYLRWVVWFFALALSACRVSVLPIESATAKAMANGIPERTWVLSEDQVAKLNGWLSQNRGGWGETRNQYVPNLLLNLRHKDGQNSTLGIAGNFVVLSFNGERHVQKFDQEDMTFLQDILGSR